MTRKASDITRLKNPARKGNNVRDRRAAEKERGASLDVTRLKTPTQEEWDTMLRSTNSAKLGMVLNQEGPYRDRVLVVDIETSSLIPRYGGRVHCAVLKTWPRGPTREFITGKGNPWNEERKLLRQVLDVIEAHSVIVGFYHANFDLPFLNNRLARHFGRVIPRMKLLDLWPAAKRTFKASKETSCRLEALAKLIRAEYPTTPLKTPVDEETWERKNMGIATDEDNKYILVHCKIDVEWTENLMDFLDRNDRLPDRIVRR